MLFGNFHFPTGDKRSLAHSAAVAESRDLFKDVGHYLPSDLVILTPRETRSADNFV
jgi:hypothetical protein